jgi:SAM-dependent methyltransferase
MRQNVYDISDKARYYAHHSYGHYKSEVYPLFVNILSTLDNGSTILDIGGGPGNMPYEFFREYPEKRIDYWILDGSSELLKIAREKLGNDSRIHTKVIDFNSDDWCRDLPQSEAAVSNNALFHLHPDRIPGFYAGMSEKLKPGGFFLNQQSMRYTGGHHPYRDNAVTRFFNAMPYAVLPQMPQFSGEEAVNMKEAEKEIKERHEKEIEQAKACGDIDPTVYHFHSVEDHLQALRDAGMAATTIWQKKEFYVILGIRDKGTCNGSV